MENATAVEGEGGHDYNPSATDVAKGTGRFVNAYNHSERVQAHCR